jgi:hypothetical protein
MRFEILKEWPADSVRILIPTIALKGFPGGTRKIIFAFWWWKAVLIY